MKAPEYKNLSKLIADGQFRIPDYQRDYVWKSGSEVEEFWEDLEEFYSDLKDGKDSKLFLGSIILLNDEDTSEDVFEVIDGQQRITTLIMTLIALREHIKKNLDYDTQGEANLERVSDDLYERIGNYKENGNFDGPRLIPSKNIKDMFECMCHMDWDYLFPKTITKSDGTIVKGKQLSSQVKILKPVYTFLSNKFENTNLQDIPHIIKAILNIDFIILKVDKVSDAYDLFERVNARGADLEVSDLLKNKLFSRVQSSDDKDVLTIWNRIRANADGNLVRMLKYFYVSQEGYVTRSQLYKYLKTKFGSDYERLILELEEFSEYYGIFQKYSTHAEMESIILNDDPEQPLLSTDRQYHIFQCLNGLHLFGITQATPLFFSMLKAYKKLRLSEVNKHKYTIESFFRNIENYHFINNYILTTVGNKVEKLYANFSASFHKSNNESDFNNNLNNLYNELSNQLQGQRELFIEEFEDLKYSRQTNKMLYIFDRFNTKIKNNSVAQSEGSAPKIFLRKLTSRTGTNNIEHWLPQGNNNDFNHYVHSIGNLLAIPVRLNSSLLDKPPNEKYDLLKNQYSSDNTYKHNRLFIDTYNPEVEWDKVKIEERARDLAVSAFDEYWKFKPKSY